MLLDHIGETGGRPAGHGRPALGRQGRAAHEADLGGTATTREVGDAIAGRIGTTG